MRKLVTRSLSCSSFRSSARIVSPKLRTKPARSPGSVPSSASFTWAVEPNAAGEVRKASRKPSPPEPRLAAASGGLEPQRAVAELLQEDLQVLADRRLQRGQDLVELDRDRGLLEREHRARLELLAARGAGLQVDEQVALEEQPRAQLQGRVLVDRAGVLVELHRDHRGVETVAVLVGEVLDRGHLADVHAGDPDRDSWPGCPGRPGRRP